MELNHLQIVFMISLVIMSLVASLWPLAWIKLMQKRRQGEEQEETIQWTFLRKPLSIGNCLACGAFTALCFLHLLPQSDTKWFLVLSQSQKNHSDIQDNETLILGSI